MVSFGGDPNAGIDGIRRAIEQRAYIDSLNEAKSLKLYAEGQLPGPKVQAGVSGPYVPARTAPAAAPAPAPAPAGGGRAGVQFPRPSASIPAAKQAANEAAAVAAAEANAPIWSWDRAKALGEQGPMAMLDQLATGAKSLREGDKDFQGRVIAGLTDGFTSLNKYIPFGTQIQGLANDALALARERTGSVPNTNTTVAPPAGPGEPNIPNLPFPMDSPTGFEVGGVGPRAYADDKLEALLQAEGSMPGITPRIPITAQPSAPAAKTDKSIAAVKKVIDKGQAGSGKPPKTAGLRPKGESPIQDAVTTPRGQTPPRPGQNFSIPAITDELRKYGVAREGIMARLAIDRGAGTAASLSRYVDGLHALKSLDAVAKDLVHQKAVVMMERGGDPRLMQALINEAGKGNYQLEPTADGSWNIYVDGQPVAAGVETSAITSQFRASSSLAWEKARIAAQIAAVSEYDKDTRKYASAAEVEHIKGKYKLASDQVWRIKGEGDTIFISDGSGTVYKTTEKEFKGPDGETGTRTVRERVDKDGSTGLTSAQYDNSASGILGKFMSLIN